ncbi:MAG: hypothetical protein UHO61_04950 [Acutalibacteraceae bacterium]|nr:hypothetical protein [Acutalibacteraceae bacterium]
MSKEVVKIPQSEDPNERCVSCFADTGIPKDMPVEKRKHYVIGCGQLCPDCYAKIKLNSESEEGLTQEELELLLEITARDSK